MSSKTYHDIEHRPRKRRRVETEEDLACDVGNTNRNCAQGNVLELMMSAEMRDIKNDLKSIVDFEKLDRLSQRVQSLQKQIQNHIMTTITFESIDSTMSCDQRQRILKRFVVCTESSIDDGDADTDIGHNYYHVSSFGKFKIGPNKKQLSFDFSCGDAEGDMDLEEVGFGDLWTLDEDCKTIIDPEQIEQFVRECGIKGIGPRASGGAFYGYCTFVYDLTIICFQMMNSKSKSRHYGVFGIYSDNFSVFDDLQEAMRQEEQAMKK